MNRNEQGEDANHFPARELERLDLARGLRDVAVVRGTEATTLDHAEVPGAHLAGLLKAAAYLKTVDGGKCRSVRPTPCR